MEVWMIVLTLAGGLGYIVLLPSLADMRRILSGDGHSLGPILVDMLLAVVLLLSALYLQAVLAMSGVKAEGVWEEVIRAASVVAFGMVPWLTFVRLWMWRWRQEKSDGKQTDLGE